MLELVTRMVLLPKVPCVAVPKSIAGGAPLLNVVEDSVIPMVGATTSPCMVKVIEGAFVKLMVYEAD